MSLTQAEGRTFEACLPQPFPELKRRRFLVGAAAAIASSVFAYTPARSSLISRGSRGARPNFAGPQTGYGGFLNSLRLRRITPESVLAAHDKCRGSVRNCLPHKSLWASMTPALRVADEMAARLGSAPEKINSAYRSPGYNARIGGARKSQHMRNCALDLDFACGAAKASRVARQLRDEGFFTGGIGIYSGFVHIDTRGTNETWWG
jgi:hypothetical protein